MGKSFRNDLLPTYKGIRKGKAISPNVKLLKRYIIDNFENVVHLPGFEADDLICDRFRTDPDNFVICSIDKDILYNKQGTHINLYDTTLVTTDKTKTEDHFYKQLIKGDVVDNIENLLPSVGDVVFY